LTPPGLLLIDLNIPRKDGTHVLSRLRRSPRCGEIPVIMISSSDSPVDRGRALELGVKEYFRKPSSLVEFMSLGKTVRRVLDESRSNSES
jgi:DNA-binding response OmpR family regulator